MVGYAKSIAACSIIIAPVVLINITFWLVIVFLLFGKNYGNMNQCFTHRSSLIEYNCKYKYNKYIL